MPKYLKTTKAVKEDAIINPFLLSPSMIEKRNKEARNKSMKKAGIAPIETGSTEKTKRIKDVKRRIVIKRVGKKFFLFLIFSFFIL